MKATGIVRRIDDLGRVVIPKEIRRTLRIREGDPLEIFTEREGSVILRKYSPIGEIGAVAGLYAESLAHTMNCIVCLTDMDQIVAASGNGSKELLNRYISKELEYAIQARKQIRTEKRKADYIPIFAGGEEYSQEIICPIISGGDVMGTDSPEYCSVLRTGYLSVPAANWPGTESISVPGWTWHPLWRRRKRCVRG